MKKPLFLTGLLCAVFSNLFSINKYPHANIDWSTGPWYTAASGGTVTTKPAAGDDVYTNGFVVAVSADETCDNLITTNVSGAITIASGKMLTVRGTLNNANTSLTTDIIGGAGTVRFTGAVNANILGSNWSANQVFQHIIFDPGPGVTLTTASLTNIKLDGTCEVLSGSLIMGAASELRGTASAVLQIDSGAGMSISGQIRSSSTAASYFPTVVINGMLTTNSYINTINFTLGNSGVFKTAFSGTNNSEGWWYNTSRPSSVTLNGVVEHNASASQLIAGNASAPFAYSHLTLSGSGVKSLFQNTAVTDTLEIGGSATFSVNAKTLTYGSNAVLCYAGTSIQTSTSHEWPATGAATHVCIGTAGVVLHAPRTLNGHVQLNGILTTSATNLLTIASGGSVGTAGSAGFINGPCAKYGTTDFIFPVGKGSKYARIGISGITNPVTFTAEYFNTGHADSLSVGGTLTGGRVSSLEYWDVSPDAAVTANVTLYWEDNQAQGISGNSSSDLVVAHYTSSNWISEGNIAASGTTSGYVKSNSVSTWSPFTFGSPSKNNPLPVKFLHFTIRNDGPVNRLSWSTATEYNSEEFKIERSVHGSDFLVIGHIKAAGESLTIRHYEFADTFSTPGAVCYRIREADRNGKEMLSEIRCLQIRLQGITISPTIFSESILLRGEFSKGDQLRITDAAGHCLFIHTIEKKGSLTMPVDTRQYKPGIYILTVYEPAGATAYRIVKTGM